MWWVAPIYAQSEIVYRLLEPLMKEIPGIRCRETRLCFSLPGGGQLWCKSADKPDTLRGEGLDGLVCDEADFIDEAIWKTLRPCLTDKKGWALFLSTPNKRGSWFHKLYKRGLEGKNKDLKSWHYPSWTNPYLDPKEIESAKQDMTKEEFDREYGALWVDSHELVYFNFNEDVHVRACPINKALPVLIGLDFNNTPRVACFVQRDGDAFRVVGELHHTTPVTTDIHAQLVGGWLTKHEFEQHSPLRWGKKFPCYPDASGKALRQGGGTNIQDFVNAGFELDYPSQNPHVADRDNIVLAHFLNAEGKVRLLIDPSCVHLIQALKELKHKTRDGSGKEWGHILDALGYLIHRIFTMEKQQQGPIVPSKPTQQAVPQMRGRATPRV